VERIVSGASYKLIITGEFKMRKLFLFNLISLDGFFEGPDKELDWHNVDAEFNDFAIQQLDSIDLILFGRITYELMASFWPTETAIKSDPVVANRMNSIQKIVFSKSLPKAIWNNTTLIKENAPEEVAKLKNQQGKDIAIFGSFGLALTLLPDKLIDEFRIMVNPVVLGKGKQMFDSITERLHLKLINTKVFKSGNVLMYYEMKE
jgi:dihydrofolate reductase